TGLKGTKASDAKKIEALIFGTLETLVREGIDPDMVAASINTLEFNLRENNTGAFPRGIAIMLRALTTWLHEDDPFKLLAFESPLNEIKTRLASDKRYFENLIKTHLLENVHRTTLRFKPDPELGRRFEEEETTRLDTIRESMSAAELKECVKNTKRLKELQETPNSPEALATMPFLQLSDLEKENKIVPIEQIQVQDTTVLYHDLFTNGIVYLDLAFDMNALPKELLPLTEIFAKCLTEMGTTEYDYVKLSQRIGKSTGGIYGNSVSATVRGSRETVSKLMVRGKSTVGQSGELLNILKDILLNTNFDNRERLKQIVLEEKSGLESSIVPRGHIFANQRVRAQFGGAGWVSDQTHGIGYLFALRQLAKDIDKKWDEVLQKLETMRNLLINGKAMLCNVTLDSEHWKSFRPHFENFIFAIPEKDLRPSTFDIKPAIQKEGLTIPAQVNYVGKAANLYDLGYEFDGSAEVITGYLRMAYLWEKVRVQGGAYGGFCVFDSNSGVFSFLSYRDPNLDATLKNYDGAANYLKHLDAKSLSDGELTKAIIAAIGDMDSYQLPDAKGYSSMLRYLTGRTDEIRQKERDEILSTNGEDFIAFGEVLEKAIKSEAVAVIGSQAAIEASKAGLKATKVL
ncbi:MAG: peptidase M16, partial [Chloroflexi bacterium]|nr:peptidase M16 [Chloroflexota bacterium]